MTVTRKAQWVSEDDEVPLSSYSDSALMEAVRREVVSLQLTALLAMAFRGALHALSMISTPIFWSMFSHLATMLASCLDAHSSATPPPGCQWHERKQFRYSLLSVLMVFLQMALG